MTQTRGITDWDRMESYNKLLKFSDMRKQLGSKQIALNHMKHSELGDTYLTLLEAVRQTGLREAEVVLHSEEAWMFCPRVPKNEQLGKGTEADVTSTWTGTGEVSGEMDMPVCAKLTDPCKEQLYLRLKKGNHDLKGLRVINQDGSGETEEIELRYPNPLNISPTSKEDPSDAPVQPTLYVTRIGLEQCLGKDNSSDSLIK